MTGQKKLIFFGTMSNVAGETLAGPVLDTAYTMYAKMDVIINVKTLTGTSPTMTYAIQEAVTDNTGAQVWIQTAVTSALAATGVTLLPYGSGGAGGANPVLGKLMQKRVVSTPGGTVGSVTTDVYFLMFN